jgi:hypothetical protein
MVMSLSQQATFLILHTSQVAMLLQLPTETIPNEFGTWKEYKESFRNSTLEEIWHQIDLGMDTISTGLYVHSFETTTLEARRPATSHSKHQHGICQNLEISCYLQQVDCNLGTKLSRAAAFAPS